MRYEDWNELLINHFFNSGMAGRRVYLYVTDELLDQLGKQDGLGDAADFRKAISKRHHWASAANSDCDGVVACIKEWRRQRNRLSEDDPDKHAPPYLAYLVFFALAAGKKAEGFSANAYYPALNELLGRDSGDGMPPGFAEVDEVWEDLERWANDEQEGRLGTFYAETDTHRSHVVNPITQMLLSEGERRHLPMIFALAGLSPTFPPSDEEVAGGVARYGDPGLRRSTRRLLRRENGTDERAREILLDAVLDILQHWDGEAEEPGARTAGGTARQRMHGTLWLTLADDGFGRFRAGLRAQVSGEFPDDELKLCDSPTGNAFACVERLGTPGWSWPLSDTGRPLDAASFDWSRDFELSESYRGWTFRLPGVPVRLFVSEPGLSGYVESRRLRRGMPFVLAADASVQAQVERWGREGCEGFQPIEVAGGLPVGWRLYRAEAARDDRLVRNELAVLAFSSTLRVRLDGVRFGQGSEFFAFAPPDFVVEGEPEGAQLFCNYRPMKALGEGRFAVPPEELDELKLRIEVRQGEEVLHRQFVFLRKHLAWERQQAAAEFDAFGRPVGAPEEESVTVAGAQVRGEVPVRDQLRTFLPVYTERSVYLIGRVPGQIAKWPQEPLPEWEPVWQVPMERRGRALFHGRSLDAAPQPGRWGSPRQVKRWKEVLWHQRKRIEPPSDKLPRARTLWLAYREAACAAK